MFVRLDTDTGLSGYGEMFTAQTYVRPSHLAVGLQQVAEDFFYGQNPTNVEYLYHRFHNSHYSHTGELLKAAIFSALEMACWDLVGKDMGKPVYELLGGQFRQSVRTYSYVSAPPELEDLGFDFWLNPDAVGERAVQLVDEGFTAMKLDPFPLLTGSDSHQSQVVPLQWSLEALDLAEETIATVRKRVGSKADIIIGTHGQMTASGAIRFARRVERFDPLWFEEPVPPELSSEMAKVAKATSIPITSGERLTSKWDFARLIRDGAVSIINPDVSQVGGLMEARKIAAVAEANYVQVSPHVYGGPFVAIASLHLSLATPNVFISEGLGRFTGIHADLLDRPIQWRDGYAYLSDRPGLGHDLNEELARSLRASDDARFWGSMGAPSEAVDDIAAVEVAAWQ